MQMLKQRIFIYIVGITLTTLIGIILFDNYVKVSKGPKKVQTMHIKDNLHETLIPDITQSDQLLVKEHFRRRAILLKACEKYNNRTQIRLNLMSYAVDDRHRVLYCPVAKILSTFWKPTMQIASGVKPGNDPFQVMKPHDSSLNTLGSIPPIEREMVLSSYRSFLFVRNPFSRLLSAYVDKFLSVNTVYWNSIGRYIIRQFRFNPSPKSLLCGHDVTFPEFIKYVLITFETPGVPIDVHINSIFNTCNPCYTKPTVIGKFETGQTDIEYVLNTFNLTDVVKYNRSMRQVQLRNHQRVVKNFMERYPRVKHCISWPAAIQRVWRKQMIRGIIGREAVIPEQLLNNHSLSVDDVVRHFTNALVSSDGEGLGSKDNKNEAFDEAYSLIEQTDIDRILAYYSPDFELFDYDLKLPVKSQWKSRTPFYFDIEH